MAYVAGKQLQIQKADGTTELRKPGELVPEATGWRNLDAWISQKRILLVPDSTPAAAPKSSVAVVPSLIQEVEAASPRRRGRPPGKNRSRLA